MEGKDLRKAGLKVTLPRLKILEILEGSTTRTTLTELTGDDRVEELARMLGGIEVTVKAREHARDMLAAMEAPTKAAAGAARRPPAARGR